MPKVEGIGIPVSVSMGRGKEGVGRSASPSMGQVLATIRRGRYEPHQPMLCRVCLSRDHGEGHSDARGTFQRDMLIALRKSSLERKKIVL